MRMPTLTPKRIALAGTAVFLAAGAAVIALSPGTRAVSMKAAYDLQAPRALEAGFQEHQARADGETGTNASASQVSLPPKLIRRAKFTVEVARLDAAARSLEALARLHGGYLAQAEGTREAGDRGRHHLNLRVPSERFEMALAGLRGEGRVLQESLSTEDVSRAYVDLEARIRNKRVAQARLRDLLLTRTGRISEVVEAEQALTQVSEEIERMEAQRRHYDEESAFCSVDVDLVLAPAPAEKPSLWAPAAASLGQSLVALRDSALALVQMLALLLPWSVPAAAGWLLYRSRRRARLQEAP